MLDIQTDAIEWKTILQELAVSRENNIESDIEVVRESKKKMKWK